VASLRRPPNALLSRSLKRERVQDEQVENALYLKDLKKIDTNRSDALTRSASYRWLGAYSPILLKRVFLLTREQDQRLEDAVRHYRHSELFFFGGCRIHRGCPNC